MTTPSSFSIGGVRLDVLSSSEVGPTLERWCASSDRSNLVFFVNAYSIVSAGKDAPFAAALNEADLSVADGVPVAWVGSHMTGMRCERLSGPDLMHEMLTAERFSHLRHFVFGGTQAALDRLEFRYNRGGTIKPQRIVGTFSPPFRQMTIEEEGAFIRRIEQVRPHILWVCLGTARQEKWMASMRSRVPVPVMAGVGAAVDFLSGQKSRAPRWMQRAGLEWLFRLATEPRRLWRRYLVGNVLFLRLAGLEIWRHHLERRQQA